VAEKKEEGTLRDPLTFGRFKKWIYDHLLPEADKLLVEGWLEEFRRNNMDLTFSEALNKIEHPSSEKDRPAVDIHDQIDWYAIWAEREETDKLLQYAEALREALKTGKIKAKDIGLYRKEEVTIKESSKWRKRAEELERKLAELEKKPPPPPPSKLTSDQIDLLYRQFETEVTKALRRGLFPREKDRFEQLIPKIENLSYEEAKKQVTMLAETIIAEEKPSVPERALIETPWGTYRFKVKKVKVIAPPIPAWCRVVATYPYLDQARSEAIKLKRANPTAYIGYAYDIERFTWAVIQCDRFPTGAETDQDGLLLIPAVRREWYE